MYISNMGEKINNRIINEKLQPLNFIFVKKMKILIFHFVELELMLV